MVDCRKGHCAHLWMYPYEREGPARTHSSLLRRGVRPGPIKQMGKGRGGARGGRDGEGQGKGRLLPCRLDLRSLYESEHM